VPAYLYIGALVAALIGWAVWFYRLRGKLLQQRRLWNKGNCPRCGLRWQRLNGSSNKYWCSLCGRRIELEEIDNV